MTETVGDLALQICHSNRQAIAALANKVSENQRTELDLIKANSKIATDAIQSISQLQAVRSSMTQMRLEKQSILQEFRGLGNPQ
ncbi:MAG: hypothetical protein SVX43_21660 [Cyanobacteriota bacterium]|nr:hypothetical protein [Cyanobacteriota bacterium]